MIFLALFMELIMGMKMFKPFVSSSECYLILFLPFGMQMKIYISIYTHIDSIYECITHILCCFKRFIKIKNLFQNP